MKYGGSQYLFIIYNYNCIRNEINHFCQCYKRKNDVVCAFKSKNGLFYVYLN